MKLKHAMKATLSAGLFGLMVLTSVKADSSMTSENKQTEVMKTSMETTATVKNIDYKNRKLTLMSEGETFELVAGDDVVNLNQIKKGDVVSAKYTEALIYNIHKGGKALAPTVSSTASTARPGAKPEANVAREVTASVIITDINRKEPSVTFKSASGEKQTFKVMHPERLEGVNVGDAVDLTYTEAFALKVEKKAKK